VSLLTRKPPVSDTTSLSEYARLAARQAVPTAVNAYSTAAQQAAPLARQAVPLARNAGTSVRQGADSAVNWATPYSDAARAWAAPRLEQSAIALSENIAPMISDALIAAAHKIDSSPRRRQRRLSKSGLLAASAVLVAAGAAAFLLRNHGSSDAGYTASGRSDAGETGEESVRVIREDTIREDTGEWPDADSDGYPHIS
jgi:hypothetical protein